MSSSVSNDIALHEKFLKLIQGTKMNERGVIVINILYGHHMEKTVRCMLYDFKKPGGNFLMELKERMGDDIEYNTVKKAVGTKIVIKDQQDMYGALVQHAIDNPNRPIMSIYLSEESSDDDDEDDDDEDIDLFSTDNNGLLY